MRTSQLINITTFEKRNAQSPPRSDSWVSSLRCSQALSPALSEVRHQRPKAFPKRASYLGHMQNTFTSYTKKHSVFIDINIYAK